MQNVARISPLWHADDCWMDSKRNIKQINPIKLSIICLKYMYKHAKMNYVRSRDSRTARETVVFTPNKYILTQTPNATRNVAEIYRNKFCRQTKLIAVSQKWSTNILKPLVIFYRLGITELCSDWSKRYFPIFRVFLTFWWPWICISQFCNVRPFWKTLLHGKIPPQFLTGSFWI